MNVHTHCHVNNCTQSWGGLGEWGKYRALSSASVPRGVSSLHAARGPGSAASMYLASGSPGTACGLLGHAQPGQGGEGPPSAVGLGTAVSLALGPLIGVCGAVPPSHLAQALGALSPGKGSR